MLFCALRSAITLGGGATGLRVGAERINVVQKIVKLKWLEHGRALQALQLVVQSVEQMRRGATDQHAGLLGVMVLAKLL
jgi:hypothetical protein